MERDCISFSALVKNSFQIFDPLTEIDYFVLVKENFLYLKLTYEKWLVYLWVGFSKMLLDIFDLWFFKNFVHKVSMLI